MATVKSEMSGVSLFPETGDPEVGHVWVKTCAESGAKGSGRTQQMTVLQLRFRQAAVVWLIAGTSLFARSSEPQSQSPNIHRAFSPPQLVNLLPRKVSDQM